MTWFEGKRTIITGIILFIYNLLRTIKPDIPLLAEADVAVAVNVVGTILIVIFRLFAKPKPEPIPPVV